jgi:hypothetical protein
MSSALFAILTALAGAFTLALGFVHLAIPRLLGYRAALAGSNAEAIGQPLPTLAVMRRSYRLRPDDLIGVTWVMSNAASYVLITIGLVDLAWAIGWRGLPLGLGAAWIAGWWAIRAAGQFALGRRSADVAVASWFAALALGHAVLALGAA